VATISKLADELARGDEPGARRAWLADLPAGIADRSPSRVITVTDARS
jgi:hypothetical protein